MIFSDGVAKIFFPFHDATREHWVLVGILKTGQSTYLMTVYDPIPCVKSANKYFEVYLMFLSMYNVH
jgi:hypothetical protein